MMAWALVWWPALVGGATWRLGRHLPTARRSVVLGVGAVGALAVTTVLAAVAAAERATATYDVGAGLTLHADLAAPANVVAVLVPAVAAVVVAWAAAHEDTGGLPRLLGLLVAFVGAMELVVVGADLLSLLVGFELVGGLSWALIGHDWRTAEHPRAAAHAFNATRFGGLGLILAAGAAMADAGSIAYDDLVGVTDLELHVLVVGVVLAAVAKSAQVPFAPWLFSAMAGPTSVSALLHSSTMVAAGAYALARLHPTLDRVAWFAPVVIGVGLATAIAGGVVALLQAHAKRLLAASTSAQYGLMLVAVGAGYPAVAVAHLVVHAVFKAQLFLSAGIAMRAVGSPLLGRMRLGRHLGATAALTAVGSLALAAVPPLGGGWSKEAVVAAAGHAAPWLALLVVVAGGLSAAYATRFHLLAFGPATTDDPGPRQLARRPSTTEQRSIAALAVASVVLGALWLPPVHDLAARLLDGALADGPAWELAASLAALAVGAYAVLAADRQGRLGHVGLQGATAAWGDWLRLPAATRRGVVDPALRLAAGLARFDDRVLDGAVRGVAGAGRRTAAGLATSGERVAYGAVAGVAGAGLGLARLGSGVAERGIDGAVARVAGAGLGLARLGTGVAERGIDGAVTALAWVVDRAGADARRTHTGQVHHQFVAIAVGLGVIAVAAVLGR